jgi:hypothetical protein
MVGFATEDLDEKKWQFCVFTIEAHFMFQSILWDLEVYFMIPMV